MTTRIGIALFDGAEELDWAGPWEVLSYWSHRNPEDGVEVFTVAQDNSEPIVCAKGLRVLATHSWDSAPEIDVLVYPGGRGTRVQVGDEKVRTWVRSIHERAHLTTSVCTGAFILADAGLLQGRAATPTGTITTSSWRSTAPSSYSRTPATSTQATSSPRQGSRQGSTWPST